MLLPQRPGCRARTVDAHVHADVALDLAGGLPACSEHVSACQAHHPLIKPMLCARARVDLQGASLSARTGKAVHEGRLASAGHADERRQNAWLECAVDVLQ